MKLTKEAIAKMSQSYSKAKTQHVAENAVTKNGILAASENSQVAKDLSTPAFAFSIDVDSQAVANQKQSGRCWMFACLNFCRFHVEKTLDLPQGTFELSQAYLAFYNKLERANWFLEHVAATASKPFDDREVTWLFGAPMQDGGDWDMVCGLIKKYGVVPHAAMVETACTNNTAQINTQLSHLLRQDGLKIRSLVREGVDGKKIEEVQAQMLDEVYRMLCVAFGEPPVKVDFEYTDTKKQFHGVYGLTPLEFYKKYVGIDLDDYIGVINVPGEDNPYKRLYAIEDSDQIPERENLYLNVDIDTLKGLVIDQLKSGEPVWFGCDVLQHCDEEAGVMDMDLYDFDELFGVDFSMDKAQRYLTRESLPTHAMMIAGVNLVDGKPDKWKIENSWGTEVHGKKVGHNGYYVCGDEWFDNFVYEVAIKKSLLSDELQKVLDTEPIVWPFWCTFNPVSAY